MTRRHPHVALVLAAAVVLAACGSGAGGPGATTASSSGPSAPLWAPPGDGALPAVCRDSLQTSIESWVGRRKLVGATAAVVTPTGVWSGAAGVDGAGTTLRPDSAMWIASTTKTFTAAEVMLLASRGLVDLDKPLSSYVDARFDTQGATVRQALAMRSGFPAYATVKGDVNREWAAADLLAAVPVNAPRLGALGGTPRYNSMNYLLLSQLVEKVTNQPFAQALRTDLLDPAGLHRIWVQTAETPTPPLSVGTNPKGSTLVDPKGPYLPSRSVASSTLGGGDLAGDAADLARWGYLLYGGHVIDSTLVKQMEADPQLEPTLGQPYALGTVVMPDDAGAVMVGHSGGGPEWPYTAVLNVWTGGHPVAVVVLTPQPAAFAEDLFDLVLNLRSDVADQAVTPSSSTS